MASHYCTIPMSETACRQSSTTTWRLAAAVGACAVAATVAFASATGTQHHVPVSSRIGANTQRVVLVTAAGKPEVDAQVQTMPAARESVAYVASSSSSQASASEVAALGSGALLFLGAGLALARQLLSSRQQQPVALMSTTGEKTDDSKAMMRAMVDTLDSTDMRLLARGASMADVAQSKGIDEVARALKAEQSSRKDLTPKDVVLEMQRGNGRFWMGLSERPDMNAMERRALIIAQAPKICILSCSDSRVPVEIIFDQGLGEVFVVRMAGNILDQNAHGSIEYAVKYLGVKVLLVIGHEGCGAVKGAISMSAEDISKEPADLQAVLNSIKNNLDVKELNSITDSRSRDREAIVLNTSNQVKQLQHNKLIAEKVADGSLLVAGAFYEISSGIVDFFSLDKNGLVVDI